MIEQAVILAAGRGSRLGQLTRERPKSMLPILGKPIMARVMDRLRDAGIRRFVVVVGDPDGAMASYLNTSWYPDASVQYAIQSVPTGTVDALQQAAPYLDGPFLLTAVDNLTSTAHVNNLIERFSRYPDQLAALSLLPATPDQIRRSSGVVIEGDWITAVEEKPADPRGAYAGIMLYAFSLSFLNYLSRVKVSARGERELVSGIQAGISDGLRVGYAITDWRLHLTHEIDLLAINRYFLQTGTDAHILSEIPASAHITSPVRIDPNVSVGRGAHLGPNVYLESGSTVGEDAVLENTIVLKGGFVPPAERCINEIIAKRVRVTAPDLS